MKITDAIKINLNKLQSLIENLDEAQFIEKRSILSGASLSGHVRHILEFYTAIFKTDGSEFCYDDRLRDIRIETDPPFAISIIKGIKISLNSITGDAPLKLRANYSQVVSESVIFETSLFRELAHVLEHSRHHQAIIKMALNHSGLKEVVSENFGTAPSTLRHQHGRSGKL